MHKILHALDSLSGREAQHDHKAQSHARKKPKTYLEIALPSKWDSQRRPPPSTKHPDRAYSPCAKPVPARQRIARPRNRPSAISYNRHVRFNLLENIHPISPITRAPTPFAWEAETFCAESTRCPRSYLSGNNNRGPLPYKDASCSRHRPHPVRGFVPPHGGSLNGSSRDMLSEHSYRERSHEIREHSARRLRIYPKDDYDHHSSRGRRSEKSNYQESNYKPQNHYQPSVRDSPAQMRTSHRLSGGPGIKSGERDPEQDEDFCNPRSRQLVLSTRDSNYGGSPSGRSSAWTSSRSRSQSRPRYCTAQKITTSNQIVESSLRQPQLSVYGHEGVKHSGRDIDSPYRASDRTRSNHRGREPLVDAF